MKKYQVRYSGSATMKPLNFEIREFDDEKASRYILSDLPSYYPAYYTADLFGEDDKLIARFSSSIVAHKHVP